MRVLLPAVFLAAAAAVYAGADQDWDAISVLRQGPGTPANDTTGQVVQLAQAHLIRQEKALTDFLMAHPDDSRGPAAQVELAGVTAALGVSLSDRNRVESAIRRLAAVERDKNVPSSVRIDAAFQRITTSMQTVLLAGKAHPGEVSGARNMIYDAAGNFASRYPDDPRAARLLAEAAVLFDDLPQKKRKILEQASVVARDEGTRGRVRDDLRRLDLLGQKGALSFETIQGGEFSLEAVRGRVVVLVFWAGWSPPSVAWLAAFARTAREWPGARVAVATVSLDRNRGNALKTMEILDIASWPTAFSGRGWDDPVARQLGINALPTAFVYDTQGRLRSLNAREDYAALVRRLLTEKTRP